jgi:hypothetical protein
VTTTDPPAAPTYAGDLDLIQAMTDLARATAVPGGTRAYGTLQLDLPSAEAVDAVAAQWGTEAAWTQDRRQYRAERGKPGLSVSAAYHPDPLQLVTA